MNYMNDANKISIRQLYPSGSVLGYSYKECLINNGDCLALYSSISGKEIVVGPFTYIDDYHFSLNNRTWHVTEFGEYLYKNKLSPAIRRGE